MIAGAALLVLAAWSPFALLRLIPMMEVAAASVGEPALVHVRRCWIGRHPEPRRLHATGDGSRTHGHRPRPPTRQRPAERRTRTQRHNRAEHRSERRAEDPRADASEHRRRRAVSGTARTGTDSAGGTMYPSAPPAGAHRSSQARRRFAEPATDAPPARRCRAPSPPLRCATAATPPRRSGGRRTMEVTA